MKGKLVLLSSRGPLSHSAASLATTDHFSHWCVWVDFIMKRPVPVNCVLQACFILFFLLSLECIVLIFIYLNVRAAKLATHHRFQRYVPLVFDMIPMNPQHPATLWWPQSDPLRSDQQLLLTHCTCWGTRTCLQTHAAPMCITFAMNLLVLFPPGPTKAASAAAVFTGPVSAGPCSHLDCHRG